MAENYDRKFGKCHSAQVILPGGDGLRVGSAIDGNYDNMTV